MVKTEHEDWCHHDMNCCGCTCTDHYTEWYEENKKNEMATLYIAGPMTGLPELNFPAFHEAEQKLKAAGYAVLNPAARAGKTKDMPWTWYLRKGIQDVTNADGLAMLPGWDDSRGARLELDVARGLEIPYTTVSGWLVVAHKWA